MAVTLDRPEGRLTNSAREWWGYGVWLFVGAVIATSELWAAAGNPWWPTISATVGHLEQLWSPVKIIVVALIAAGATQMIIYPPHRREFGRTGRRAQRSRTASGRLTRAAGGQADPIRHAELYFPTAVGVIAGGAATAAWLSSSKFVVGYVLYGLIAVAFLIIPNVLAFWFAKDVPFPTLFRTLADLDEVWHPAVLIIVAGLSVLVVHLVAYPWP
jgi:hypothetical protein